MGQIDIKETVAQQLQTARKSRNLTLKELGERLCVAEATVSRYESGKQNLTLETLQKIAEALNMTFTTSMEG